MSDRYIKAPNVSIELGDVCEHGSLKRQCLTCELQEQLQAADALAKAMYRISRLTEPIHKVETLQEIESIACEALAAYEKVRGME